MNKSSRHRWWLLVFGLSTQPAIGDQFHYANVLMGDRAMGLGGAFTAVADDASGLIYNPAGLAFALSNDISGSGNAFYRKKVTYKRTMGIMILSKKATATWHHFLAAYKKLITLFPMPHLLLAFSTETLS